MHLMNCKLNICLSLFFVFILQNIYPQVKSGNVEIIQDTKIEQLVQKHRTLNEKIHGIPGFRIQIFSESGTNSKNKATKVKDDFFQKFSDEEVYILFQEPNYKVRIGDFRTQLDALGFLHKIQGAYPNAFIVNDKINFPKLH
jgi:hypothetical protein